MKSVKLLLLLLATGLSACAQFNYVQQMAYRDYGVFSQMNIGKGKLAQTNGSAYLELGDSANSRKGFLFPRGKKDSVSNPAKGLVIFDIPSGKLQIFDGITWVPLGAGAGAITGAGTGGRIPVWTSGATLGNSTIYDNGTNVGIGVSPHAVYKLSVSGHGYFDGTIIAGAAVHTTGSADYKVMADFNGNFRYVPDTGADTALFATMYYVNRRDDSIIALIDSANYFDATAPSTSPIEGLNNTILGTTTIKAALQELIYPAQPPTASLTLTYNGYTAANLDLEYMAAGAALPIIINWTAGRQTNTAPLATVDVDGGLQSFTQPGLSSTINGTVSKTFARNTFKNFHSDVTATDGKVAYGNASVHWYYKRYWGFVNSTNPSDAALRAGGQAFINNRTQDLTGAYNPTGSQYYFIAFPEAYDPSNFSQIWIGGLDQTAAFTRTVRSFTNASGATTFYIVYISNSLQSGAIAHEIK